MKINIVSGGILKNSLIKMIDSRIFVYFSPSNEHFEISKRNCTAIKNSPVRSRLFKIFCHLDNGRRE